MRENYKLLVQYFILQRTLDALSVVCNNLILFIPTFCNVLCIAYFSFPWLCPFPPTHLSLYPPPLTSLCTEMLHLSFVMFQHPPPLVQPLVMMTIVLQNGCSPLYGASFGGRLDVVKTLLEAGAIINQANNVGTCDIHDVH